MVSISGWFHSPDVLISGWSHQPSIPTSGAYCITMVDKRSAGTIMIDKTPAGITVVVKTPVRIIAARPSFPTSKHQGQILTGIDSYVWYICKQKEM